MPRRLYPKHSGDAFDRFITERCQDETGRFEFWRMLQLFEALDCLEFIPAEGSNGTKRMTAGIRLRNYFADGVLVFRDGSTVQLNLEEEST